MIHLIITKEVHHMNSVLKIKQILIAFVLFLIIAGGSIFTYCKYIMEDTIIQNIVQNSKEDVKRLQVVREYYTKYIVSDIKKNAPDIQLDFDHKDIDYSIPFPTTVIHDLTQMYSQRSDIKFEFYSEFPFLNRKDRVLTNFQKEAIKMVEESDEGIYYKKDQIDGKNVLRVAVADYMILPACVNCHNTHKLKDWSDDKWKLGDKRGIIEIITPIK